MTTTAGVVDASSIITSLYKSGKYSDLLIQCQGRKFKVHRAVVCLQSKVLAAAVDGEFREASTGEIELDDDEPEIVANMIKFLYTQTYDDDNDEVMSPLSAPTVSPTSESKAEHTGALLTNVKLYIIGDRYDIPALKVLAEKKYKKLVQVKWNTSSFSSSLRLLYEQTPESDRLLKDTAIEVAGEHVKELTDREEFATLCKENGEIAFELLKASLASKKPPLKPCIWHKSTSCTAYNDLGQPRPTFKCASYNNPSYVFN